VTHAQLGVPPIRPRVGPPDTSRCSSWYFNTSGWNSTVYPQHADRFQPALHVPRVFALERELHAEGADDALFPVDAVAVCSDGGLRGFDIRL
jgi:hypothetical protein